MTLSSAASKLITAYDAMNPTNRKRRNRCRLTANISVVCRDASGTITSNRVYTMPSGLPLKALRKLQIFHQHFWVQHKKGLASSSTNFMASFPKVFVHPKCIMPPASGHDVVASIVDLYAGLLAGYHHLGRNHHTPLRGGVRQGQLYFSFVLASQCQTLLNGSSQKLETRAVSHFLLANCRVEWA